MNLRELENLIVNGEGLYTEFKEKLPETRKLIKELVGFANTKGGKLFLGVKDNGAIKGVRDIDEAMEIITMGMEFYSRPPIQADFSIVRVSPQKSVLIISVSPAKDKPVFLLDDFKSEKGIAIIRSGEESFKASREMFFLLISNNNPKGTLIQYGDKEKFLMKYLESHEVISLNTFRKKVKISRIKASKTLIILVRAGIIGIIPGVSEDQYFRIKDFEYLRP